MESRTCVCIDPAWDASVLTEFMEEKALTLTSIWLTHGHHDHVNAIDDVLLFTQVPVYISMHESPSLIPSHVSDLRFVSHLDTLSLGNYSASCIHTPGHTSGSMCFLIENMLISGDTLFVDGCGRCNFESSNPSHMYASLQILKKLPPKTRIFPGHDYHKMKSDLIENQQRTNRFLLCKDEKEFLKKRMRLK